MKRFESEAGYERSTELDPRMAIDEAERVMAESEPASVDPAAARAGEYVPWTAHVGTRGATWVRDTDALEALAESLADIMPELDRLAADGAK